MMMHQFMTEQNGAAEFGKAISMLRKGSYSKSLSAMHTALSQD
jgi:hypothetical protein